MELDFYTLEQKILKKLEDQGASLSWLYRKTGISVTHLHNVLRGTKWKKRLTPEMLNKINSALGTDFQF